MDLKKGMIYVSLWWPTAYAVGLSVLSTTKGSMSAMEIAISIAVPIVVAIISILGTLLVTRRNRRDKQAEAIRELTHKGELAQKDLSHEHSEISNTLMLEFSDRGVLALKMKDISERIRSSEKAQNERYLKFKRKNKNIMDTLSDIEGFLKDWEALSAEVEQLRKENAQLRDRVNAPIITPPTGRGR